MRESEGESDGLRKRPGKKASTPSSSSLRLSLHLVCAVASLSLHFLLLHELIPIHLFLFILSLFSNSLKKETRTERLAIIIEEAGEGCCYLLRFLLYFCFIRHHHVFSTKQSVRENDTIQTKKKKSSCCFLTLLTTAQVAFSDVGVREEGGQEVRHKTKR